MPRKGQPLMICVYCEKPVPLVFVMLEDVPGVGPTSRNGCFPCISILGEKIMREYHAAQGPPEVTPDGVVRAPLTECKPCSGCGGMRRENCKDYGKHHHDWCDCQ